MKYAVILPDGAADDPLPELEGRTPLEAARIPNMDWVATNGRLGRIVTIPDGFTPGTDVGTLSVLGYDPRAYYSGRAPIEAAAKGLSARPDQMIFRCNFVTILDGIMKDNTGGHIRQEETDTLIAALNGALAAAGSDFHAGVTYRNLMLLTDAAGLRLRCAPPHDIIDQPVAAHQPQGDGAERVVALQERARALLAGHEVNRARRAEGRPPVTDIWLWGQGRPVPFEPFAERFGPRAAVITGVDILRGFARLMGMRVIDVPGATGYIDTNYAGKGEAAVAALDEVEMIVAHVEAADESAHMGNPAEKVKALERIDELVVGPLLRRLRAGEARGEPWRMLVAVDHPTPCTTRGHSSVPPLFAYAGTGVTGPATGSAPRAFTEGAADRAGDWIREGHRLMAQFLGR
jgi:2,3-bisphosphoglycerate-independent phosphoglycerate mutase